MATDEQQEVLAGIAESRGYTLEMHGIMAAADPDWVEKYNAFIEATYTGERTLDRKTKELLQVAVEAALPRRCRPDSRPHPRSLAGGRDPHRDTGGPAMRRHAHGRPGLPPWPPGVGRRNGILGGLGSPVKAPSLNQLPTALSALYLNT